MKTLGQEQLTNRQPAQYDCALLDPCGDYGEHQTFECKMEHEVAHESLECSIHYFYNEEYTKLVPLTCYLHQSSQFPIVP
jgi:hypothetical protein